MKEWLENEDEEDDISDSEIWAEVKHPDNYTLADLTSWINKKEMVKGKKPAIAASPSGRKLEKRKKERKVSSSEESSPDERKKSKSKSKKKLSE